MPEVPTTAEAGLPELVSFGWFAAAAPPKTPAALQAEIAKATIEVSRCRRAAEIPRAGVEPVASSPADTAAFIRHEAHRWGEVIKKTNRRGLVRKNVAGHRCPAVDGAEVGRPSLPQSFRGAS